MSEDALTGRIVGEIVPCSVNGDGKYVLLSTFNQHRVLCARLGMR